MAERPDLFQRVVAASPVAGWDHNVIFPHLRASLAHLSTHVRLDLSAGDQGFEADLPQPPFRVLRAFA